MTVTKVNDVNLFDAETQRCPYDAYKTLRDEAIYLGVLCCQLLLGQAVHMIPPVDEGHDLRLSLCGQLRDI